MPVRPDLTATLATLDIPTRLPATDLLTAARDAEILAGKLREHTSQMHELLQDIGAGRVDGLAERMAELGITEADYVADGGGFIAIVVIVILLFATAAY